MKLSITASDELKGRVGGVDAAEFVEWSETFSAVDEAGEDGYAYKRCGTVGPGVEAWTQRRGRVLWKIERTLRDGTGEVGKNGWP